METGKKLGKTKICEVITDDEDFIYLPRQYLGNIRVKS